MSDAVPPHGIVDPPDPPPGDPPPTAIVLTLPPPAHLAGTVPDGSDEGLAGVKVEISKAPGYTGQHQATTDAEGHYDLGYVQAGSRTIHAYGTSAVGASALCFQLAFWEARQ